MSAAERQPRELPGARFAPASSEDLLPGYERARRFFEEELIRREVPSGPNPLTRRQWMERFLPLLGHPERSFGAIHVAGTSGKGSISVMIAEILRAAGVRAGLHVSPYVQVLTEKLWVDGRYASVAELGELAAWFRPIAERQRGPHVPLHGLSAVAITLEHFRRAGVEVGVIEVGVGGREDLTNVLRTSVAVVGPVGLDHQRTLGDTIEEIAWHKAGIVRPGCRAVALAGPGAAAAAEQSRAAGAPLRVVTSGDFAVRRGEGGRCRLEYRGPRFRLQEVELGMAGAFQAANAALAIAAIEAWDPAGERVDEGAVRLGLSRARLPGRLELVRRESLQLRPAGQGPMGPRQWQGQGPESGRGAAATLPVGVAVLLDGAHNPDKLAALRADLTRYFRRRLHVVFGAIAAHSPGPAVLELAARAATFVATEPLVYGKEAWPAGALRDLLVEAASRPDGAGSPILACPDPQAALDLALAEAREGDLLLVTGSLYLVGSLRNRWFPPPAVLEQRQSWPAEERGGPVSAAATGEVPRAALASQTREES